MIDPNWQLVDLDPKTWRSIGRFIDPGMFIRSGTPDENALFVIHDRGRVLNVTDTTGARLNSLSIDVVEEPWAVAQTLYETGSWERVHIVDRAHLALVAEQAQQLANRELTLDAYYRNVFLLIWNGGAGYVSIPPHPGHWNGWTYEGLRQFVDQLKTPSSLALCVIRGAELEIGLIAEISEGLIRKVTTFEALAMSKVEMALSSAFLDRLWAQLGSRFHPPAAALICSDEVFEAWVFNRAKGATIHAAVLSGQAFLRLREDPPLLI